MARKQNEYIETPLRPQLPAVKSNIPRLKDDHSPPNAAVAAASGPVNSRSTGFPSVHRPIRPGLFLHGGGQLPITAQPTVATFKKEKLPDSLSSTSDGTSDEQHQESIICRQCRRCKCEACRTPRHLPSKWICHDKFLCSANNVVDYCSCMCCVKGLFYHWGKDYEMDSDVTCADQPCSCSPHKRILRWACLGLLSLPLPCLCCYWPLRGCVKTCEKCYMRYTARGCRCTPHHRTQPLPSEQAPDKRLLDANSDC